MENPLDRIEDTFELELPVPKEETLESYLETVLADIGKLGEDLRETQFYTGGKPWLEITDDPNAQQAVLHFFNEGGEYLLSIDGNVSKGHWRLLDTSNKIIIERGQNVSELYELAFLNNYFFVLRKHGHRHRQRNHLFLGYEPYVKELRWRDAVDLLYNEYRNQWGLFKTVLVFVIILVVVIALFSTC